jgi:hypothetical protein
MIGVHNLQALRFLMILVRYVCSRKRMYAISTLPLLQNADEAASKIIYCFCIGYQQVEKRSPHDVLLHFSTWVGFFDLGLTALISSVFIIIP